MGKSRSIINFLSTVFLKIGSHDEEKEIESGEEIDIQLDETKQNFNNSCFKDDKMLFVHQSSEMKHNFNTYGNQFVLLDATYKTAKGALTLFFLFVKTDVHFQVSTVLAGIYLLKVNNRNTRTRCEIYSKLTIKAPERRLELFWCLYC